MKLEKRLLKHQPDWYDDVAWEAFEPGCLTPAELAILTYDQAVEAQTPGYALLVKAAMSASVDLEIEEFRAVWQLEEMYHSIALAEILARNQGLSDQKEINAWRELNRETNFAANQNSRYEFIKLGLAAGALRFLDQRALPAGVLTIATRNEFQTLGGYQLSAKKTSHPELRKVFGFIRTEEAAHGNAWYHLAEKQLTDSPKAQKFTRWLLGRSVTLVGEGYRPTPEADKVIKLMSFDEDGQLTLEGATAIRRVDIKLASLPGLEGVTPFEDRVKQAQINLQAAA